MPRTLKLFHARPNSGLDYETRSIRAVIERINHDHGWDVIRFTDYVTEAPSTPAATGNVQENIDPALMSADIVVFTVGHQYGNWTEQEYDTAIAQWRKGKTPRILCYFAHVRGELPRGWSAFHAKCMRDGCQELRHERPEQFEAKLKNDLEWVLTGGTSQGRASPQSSDPSHRPRGLLVPRLYVLSGSAERKLVSEQLGLCANETVYFISSDHQPLVHATGLAHVEKLAQDNARKKLDAGAPRVRDSIHRNRLDSEPIVIVAADTLVYCGREVYSSPVPFSDPHVVGMSNEERHFYKQKAKEMLKTQLTCEPFHVVTGLAFRWANNDLDISTVVATSEVWPEIKRNEIDHELEPYLAELPVLLRAGAVTIDGRWIAFIDKIKGSFFTVAGLPLAPLCEHLRSRFGVSFRPVDAPVVSSGAPRAPLSVLSIGDINYDLIHDGLEPGLLEKVTPPGAKLKGEIHRRAGGTAYLFARQCREVGFEKITVGGIFGDDPPGEFIQTQLETPPKIGDPTIEAIPGRQRGRPTSIAIIIRERAPAGEADASLTITDAKQHLANDFAERYPQTIQTADVVYVSGYALADPNRQKACIGALKAGAKAGAVTVVDITVDFDKSWRIAKGDTSFHTFVQTLDDGDSDDDMTVVHVLVSETSELIRWIAADNPDTRNDAEQLAKDHATDWTYILKYIAPELRRYFRVALLRTPRYTEQLIVRFDDETDPVPEELDYQKLSPQDRTGYGDKRTAAFIFGMVGPKILLASRSTQRLRLLEQVIHPRQLLSCATGANEEISPGETIEARVLRLAKSKADSAYEAWQNRSDDFVRGVARFQDSNQAVNLRLSDNIEIIIAADTEAAWLDGEPIPQPEKSASIEDLFNGLKKLRDQRHQMVTGVCIMGNRATDGRRLVHTGTVRTEVRWRSDIPDADLWAYAQTRDGVGKAGGYGIQGFAGCFVEEIEGSHSNVVGLPLEYICKILKREFGMPIWSLDRVCGWRSPNPLKENQQ